MVYYYFMTLSSNTRSQMRKGTLEFTILLALAARERMYASDIIGHLKGAGLDVIEGTLYPLLSRLRREELLDHAWEESKSGPPRKYYSLTSSGRKTLKELKDEWEKLAESISRLT